MATQANDAPAPLEKISDVSFAAHAWSPGIERPTDEDVALKERVETAIPIASVAEPPEPQPIADRESTEPSPAQQESVLAKNTAPALTEEPQESREFVAKEAQDIPPSQAVKLEDAADPKTEQRAAQAFVVTADQESATQSRAAEEETVVEHVITSSAAPTGTTNSAPKVKVGSAGASSKSRRLVRKAIAKSISKPPLRAAKKIATRKKAPEKVATARPAKKPKAIPILAKGGGVDQSTWNSDQWTYWNSYRPYQF
jgi:hypothetical protein